jgi:hypothetical protein
MTYKLAFGRYWNTLEAPYSLLVRAFGNDGTVTPRDDYKQMCQWDVPTPYGTVEVYDYKVGRCYAPDGLEREQITLWDVDGTQQAIEYVRSLLDAADEEEN